MEVQERQCCRRCCHRRRRVAVCSVECWFLNVVCHDGLDMWCVPDTSIIRLGMAYFIPSNNHLTSSSRPLNCSMAHRHEHYPSMSKSLSSTYNCSSWESRWPHVFGVGEWWCQWGFGWWLSRRQLVAMGHFEDIERVYTWFVHRSSRAKSSFVARACNSKRAGK